MEIEIVIQLPKKADKTPIVSKTLNPTSLILLLTNTLERN